MAIIQVKFFSNCLMRNVPFTAVLPNDGAFSEYGGHCICCTVIPGMRRIIWSIPGYVS